MEDENYEVQLSATNGKPGFGYFSERDATAAIGVFNVM